MAANAPRSSNEDCLYLHVYAPQTTSNVKLPVMFWIFGGGYVMGDGYEFGFYDGMNMATKYNAIVVARESPFPCQPAARTPLPAALPSVHGLTLSPGRCLARSQLPRRAVRVPVDA